MGKLVEIALGTLVATSTLYMTTSTVVIAGDRGCLVVDPAVTVREIDELAGELGARRARPVAGFSTHPHWDHVLWAAQLGDVTRYATPATVAMVEQRHEVLMDEAEQEAPGHDAAYVGRLTPLPEQGAPFPWDGPEAQVVSHSAHAPGHAAIFFVDHGVLVAGDMCSDVEVPLLDLGAADPLGDYHHGLDRLAALNGVRHVIPGHGHTGNSLQFRRRLDADRRYLDLLEIGQPFDDQRCQSEWLQMEHTAQLRWAREVNG